MSQRASKLYWVALFAVACAGTGSPSATTGPTTANVERAEQERAQRAAAAPEPDDQNDPEGTIPVFEGGRQTGMVTREGARRRGLTVLDLGDEWTPDVFAEDPELGEDGRQPYRARFLRLANEQTRSARRFRSADRYLELYGIFPTFSVLRARLDDDERHACHDAVDDGPIEAMERSMRPGADMRSQRRRSRAVSWLRDWLERRAHRRRLESIDELADDRRWGRELRRLRQLESELSAVQAVQAHLRCEGFLHPRAREGVLDAWTGQAIRTWQSKQMIISLASQLDQATRTSLTMDTRELDLLSTLRALRERVASSAGLIEDGTASNEWATVADRHIDLDDEFHWVSRLDPLPDGAPDLVGRATDAAARALGWTDPAAARAWLDAHAAEPAPHRYVAVQLPPLPAYHAEHMELRVEIDRGDVWYTFPYTEEGRPRGFRVRRRPTVVIYARDHGRDVPLVRWNTTIGGWQPEINPDGGVGMRYKESDVGGRVWRDVIASPAWLPPPSTPDEELLRRRRGEWRVKDSITGPGYDSAYGLAMVIHHRVRGDGEDESDWVDNGIRSHGSVNYRSILRGHSHGCHRLFNHLAVRMTSFLLRHRHHVVHGRIPALFSRELHPEPNEETGEVPDPLTLEIRHPRLPLRAHAAGAGRGARGDRPRAAAARADRLLPAAGGAAGAGSAGGRGGPGRGGRSGRRRHGRGAGSARPVSRGATPARLILASLCFRRGPRGRRARSAPVPRAACAHRRGRGPG